MNDAKPVLYYKRDHIDLPTELLKGMLPTPLHYQINVTTACNMACAFCPVSLDEYKELSGGFTFISVDDYKLALAQMQELGRARVLSHYLIGEPTLNKNFLQMLKLAKEANVADLITATTNASLIMTEKAWAAMCDSGLDMLRCSILGTDEEKYKARGQSGVTMAKVMANIAGLKNYRDSHGYKTPHICLRTHTTNKADADEFKAKFQNIGDELVVDFLFDWNGAMGKDEQGRGRFSGITDEEMYGSQPQFFHERKKACPYPFYTLIVLSDLKVTICSTDWAHWNTVGDMRKETLSEIWHGEKIKEFRRMHLQHRRCELSACSSCGFIHNVRHEDNIDHLTEAILGDEPKRMESWSPVV